MYTHEELKRRLNREWTDLMERIRQVNVDVADRFYSQPLTFDLDAAQDRLKVVIGGVRPASTYTQGMNSVYFDLDTDTDVIAAITIRDVSAFMRQHAQDHVWTSLLELLQFVKTIEVPPVAGRDSGRDAFARGLRDLIFV